MTEMLSILPSFVAGLLLGVIFFAGLWWTVQKGLVSNNPALWFVSSLIIRTTITVSGFYFISAGSWQKLVACLLGFLIMRIFISHFFRLPVVNSTLENKENHDALNS